VSDFREGTLVRVVRGHACGTSGKIRKLPKNYELVEVYERGHSVLLMVLVENLHSESSEPKTPLGSYGSDDYQGG
jgi:hypothetical protein